MLPVTGPGALDDHQVEARRDLDAARTPARLPLARPVVERLPVTDRAEHVLREQVPPVVQRLMP